MCSVGLLLPSPSLPPLLYNLFLPKCTFVVAIFVHQTKAPDPFSFFSFTNFCAFLAVPPSLFICKQSPIDGKGLKLGFWVEEVERIFFQVFRLKGRVV